MSKKSTETNEPSALRRHAFALPKALPPGVFKRWGIPRWRITDYMVELTRLEELNRDFFQSALVAAAELNERTLTHFLPRIGRVFNPDRRSAASPRARERLRQRLIKQLAPLSEIFANDSAKQKARFWEVRITQPNWTTSGIDLDGADRAVSKLLAGRNYVGVWALNYHDSGPNPGVSVARKDGLLWTFIAVVWDARKKVTQRIGERDDTRLYAQRIKSRSHLFFAVAYLMMSPTCGLRLGRRKWRYISSYETPNFWQLESWSHLAEIPMRSLVSAGGDGRSLLEGEYWG